MRLDAAGQRGPAAHVLELKGRSGKGDGRVVRLDP